MIIVFAPHKAALTKRARLRQYFLHQQALFNDRGSNMAWHIANPYSILKAFNSTVPIRQQQASLIVPLICGHKELGRTDGIDYEGPKYSPTRHEGFRLLLAWYNPFLEHDLELQE